MYFNWISDNPVASPVVICIINFFAIILMLPCSILAVGTGWAMNHSYQNIPLVLLIGTSSVWIGTWLGSIVAVLLGRTILKKQVQRFIEGKNFFKAIDTTIHKEGWQFVFLLRLCFLIPFNVSNYVFGVSSIKLKDFVLGGFGTLPFVFFEIYTGACATDIQKAISGKQELGPVKIAVMVASCVLGVFVVVYVTKRVKRQL